ncbi:MAG: nucleotide exchange factor GrpE [Candidatus Altiarchaeales archaeon HGW-Altiarchaeales-3]|nr:MAG: nucleotide exchange factor GrpE [Candidatus Altiarchaeales archaeon HGW-Altiarchaeales-3]
MQNNNNNNNNDNNNQINILKSRINDMNEEFRRYKERVKENEKKYSEKTKKEFINNLIETLDALNRAIKDSTTGDAGSLKMIYQGLLDSYDIIPVSPGRGELYDDIKHAALEVLHNPDYPENSVLKVVRAGYLFDGNIIRPAEVVISIGGENFEAVPLENLEKPGEQKDGEKQKSFWSAILEPITRRLFKEKIDELNEKFSELDKKSGELKLIEDKFIDREIELKRDMSELEDKQEKIDRAAGETKEKEEEVLKRDEKIKEHDEKTIIAMLNDIFARESEISKREHNAAANEELIKDKINEIKNTEYKLSELTRQLEVRTERINAREMWFERERMSKLAEIEEMDKRANLLSGILKESGSSVDILDARRNELLKECKNIEESIKDYELKKQEYDELNKNLVELNSRIKELEKKEDSLKNRILILEKKKIDLIVENMEAKKNG